MNITESMNSTASTVSEALALQNALPFWVMPISFTTKVVLTSIAFGFDIRFGPRPAESAPKRIAKALLKYTARFTFILLALNCWRCDIMKLVHLELSHAGDILEACCLVWATSPNLASALSVWISAVLFSPAQLFRGMRPRYCNILGFPLLPCTASWLPWDKHLYCLILAPYFIPAFVIYTAFGRRLGCCAAGLISRIAILQVVQLLYGCLLCFAAFKSLAGCLCWALAAALTLLLWSHAREAVHTWWQSGAWAVWTLVMILAWAELMTWIGVAIYGKAVSVDVQTSMSDMCNGQLAGIAEEVDAEEEEEAYYRKWDPFRQFQEHISDDFDVPLPQTGGIEGELGTLSANDVCKVAVPLYRKEDVESPQLEMQAGVFEICHLSAEDVGRCKLDIVRYTIIVMNAVPLVSMICVVTFCRLAESGNIKESIEATIGERHIDAYLAGLWQSGVRSFAEASALVNRVWASI